MVKACSIKWNKVFKSDTLFVFLFNLNKLRLKTAKKTILKSKQTTTMADKIIRFFFFNYQILYVIRHFKYCFIQYMRESV